MGNSNYNRKPYQKQKKTEGRGEKFDFDAGQKKGGNLPKIFKGKWTNRALYIGIGWSFIYGALMSLFKIFQFIRWIWLVSF